MRSSTATNTSSGVLPAPAPSPAAEPSMRRAPASMAASELATPMARLWWPWKPISVSGRRAARSAPMRARHVVGQHVAGRVGAVDAVGAVALHELAPARASSSGATMCAIIRKPTVSRPSLRAGAMCCSETSASVQCVATRIVPTPQSAAMRQVVDGADARQEQRRDLGALQPRDHGAQVLLVGVRGKAVVDRGAAEAVAVRHLDERHAGGVERGRRRRSSARA